MTLTEHSKNYVTYIRTERAHFPGRLFSTVSLVLNSNFWSFTFVSRELISRSRVVISVLHVFTSVLESWTEISVTPFSVVEPHLQYDEVRYLGLLAITVGPWIESHSLGSFWHHPGHYIYTMITKLIKIQVFHFSMIRIWNLNYYSCPKNLYSQSFSSKRKVTGNLSCR